MDAGVMDDAAQAAEDRRQRARRELDVVARTIVSDERSFDRWRRALWIGGAVGTVLTTIAGTLGLRVWSPADDVQQIETRVAVLEQRILRNSERIAALHSDLSFVTYLQCVQLRRTDRDAVPAECGERIREGPRNAGP